jgi:hypothetical protein
MIMQENLNNDERNGFISIELLATYVNVGIVLLFSLTFVCTLSTVNAQEHDLDLKQTIDPCTMPDHSLHLSDDGSVHYNSSTLIAGFQFNVEGATVLNATGGHAKAANFTLPVGGNTVLGFSLNGATISGCGTMISLMLEGEATGLSGIIISDTNGKAIAGISLLP